MATITKGHTFGATEEVTNAKLHALVEDGTVTEIVNADIDATAQIADSKLAAISTASKVSGASLYSLGDTPAGAGVLPVTGGGTGVSTDTYDADKVDGIHASATAAASKLLSLNADSKLPASITGDSDTVDTIHADASPVADKLLALDASSQFPGTVIAGRKSVYVATEEATQYAGHWTDCTYGSGSVILAGNSMVMIGFYGETKSGGGETDVRLKLVWGGSDIISVDKGEAANIDLILEAKNTENDLTYRKFARVGVIYAAAGTHTVKFRKYTGRTDGFGFAKNQNKGWWAIAIPI